MFDWLRRRSSETAPPRATPLAPGERIYAVGDVHGQLALLDQLHDLIAADTERNPAPHCQLVYLGDFIDRGPDSRGVIERLMSPRPDLPAAIHLRGNHEQTLLDCLADSARLDEWRSFGGIDTLLSYGVPAGLLKARTAHAETIASLREQMGEQLGFYQSLRLSAEAGQYFFCHAGVRPGVPLHRQVAADLLWIREPFLDSPADFGRIVVHGHTPSEGPQVRRNRINIDTGAYATGVLTAAVLEGDSVRFLNT